MSRNTKGLWGYADRPGNLKIFFNLCFIGPVGFDEHWTDQLLASILFASASVGFGSTLDHIYGKLIPIKGIRNK